MPFESPEERAQFIADIVLAVTTHEIYPQLSEDERRWVRLAIQREAERAEFRRSVITKSSGALLAAFLVGGCTFAWDHVIAFIRRG
jgi:hypothetical protein